MHTTRDVLIKLHLDSGMRVTPSFRLRRSLPKQHNRVKSLKIAQFQPMSWMLLLWLRLRLQPLLPLLLLLLLPPPQEW